MYNIVYRYNYGNEDILGCEIILKNNDKLFILTVNQPAFIEDIKEYPKIKFMLKNIIILEKKMN